jgi:hypothetical protein
MLYKKGLCNWNMYWNGLKLWLDGEPKVCPALLKTSPSFEMTYFPWLYFVPQVDREVWHLSNVSLLARVFLLKVGSFSKRYMKP